MISTHGKKELLISEEMDNTQSVEEYVEIIAAPHIHFSSGNLENDPHLLMHLNNQPHSHPFASPETPHIFKEDEFESVIDRCKLQRPPNKFLNGGRSKIDEDSDEDIGYRESDEEEPMDDEPI